MNFLGIDPGLDGAFALLDDAGKVVAITDMPVAKAGKKRVVDETDLVELLERLTQGGEIAVALEKVNGIPGQSAPAAFNFGASWGLIRGFLASRRVPYELVTPQRWKRRILAGQPKEKDSSRLFAKRKWPERARDLTRKKDHNRADALLIAEWLRREHGTTSVAEARTILGVSDD